MTSHRPPDASHTASSSGEMEAEQAVPTTPQQLPPSSAEQSELQRQKTARELESQLADVRQDLRTIEQELLGYAARLNAATDPGERERIKSKGSWMYEGRRKSLVAKEAYLLRKIDSFNRAADVQRHEEAKRGGF